MSDDKKKDQTGVEILPHNYDGIQELDNPLPGWWLLTFYITIVFSVGYYGYYEIFNGPDSDQYLAESLKSIKDNQSQAVSKSKEQPLKSYEEMLTDKKKMMVAQAHFSSKCAACHGQRGEGVIGPNLTDAFWLHSKGDIQGLLKAIQAGFLEKGMPGWKDLIPIEDQPYLAAYVKSLQGTNPPNGKAPQGEQVQ